MPFLFLFFGILFTVAAVRNTHVELLTLLKNDLTGQGNFFYWMVSILAIGSLGYIPQLRPVSRAFMVLVIIVLFLDNKGVFANFQSALSATQSNQSAIVSTN